MYVDPYRYVHVHVSSSCFIKGAALKAVLLSLFGDIFRADTGVFNTAIDLAILAAPPKKGYSHL